MNYFWAFWWLFSMVAMALILKGVRISTEYGLNLLDPDTRFLVCLPFVGLAIWWIMWALVLPLIQKWKASKRADRNDSPVRNSIGDR